MGFWQPGRETTGPADQTFQSLARYLTDKPIVGRNPRLAHGNPSYDSPRGAKTPQPSYGLTALFGATPLGIDGDAVDVNNGPFLIQAGNTTAVTDSSGSISISYPQAFPTGVVAVVVTRTTGAGITGEWYINPTLVTRFLFKVALQTSGGAALNANLSRQVSWIAVGY